MNKGKRNNIQLLGTLNNADESGIIANANQIYDANEDKSTQDVSEEHTERIKDLETKENSMQTTLENITKTGEASAASNVTYNHSDSKLDATNMQQAIDEVYSKGNTNRENTKSELEKSISDNKTAIDASIQDVYKKSNYNDGDNIIDFNTIHIITDNPEFAIAAVDANDRILYGIKADGQPCWGVGVPKVVRDYVDKQVNDILGTDNITETIDRLKEVEKFLSDFKNSDTLKALLDTKANKIDVQQAIDEVRKRSNYNDGENIIDFNTIHLITDNPEFACAAVDSDNKILYGIKTNGQPYFGVGCPQQVKDYIDEQINNIFGTDDITEGIQNLLDKIDALPDHIVTDANYVHTDNNYTTEEKTKLANAITEEQDPTVPQWAKQSSKPTYTAQEVGALPDDTPLFSGDYNDLSNKPTIPTALSQLSEDSTHRVVSDAEKTTWNNKSNFSGSYNDLTDKPTIPTVPTNVSAFTNDAGYLTQHQDISGKEDVTTIVAPVNATDATLPITTLTTEVGKYYCIDVAVDTLAVTLPAMSDLTTVRTVVIYLTAGTTPAITISSTAPSGGTAPDVYYQDGYEIKAGKTYEVNALFNGSAWIIASVEIVVPTNEGE